MYLSRKGENQTIAFANFVKFTVCDLRILRVGRQVWTAVVFCYKLDCAIPSYPYNFAFKYTTSLITSNIHYTKNDQVHWRSGLKGASTSAVPPGPKLTRMAPLTGLQGQLCMLNDAMVGHPRPSVRGKSLFPVAIKYPQQARKVMLTIYSTVTLRRNGRLTSPGTGG